ncbi:unnamed protein product, partial [Polarella glacialis]
QFYFSLGSQQNVKASADLFVLFGQHSARSRRTLPGFQGAGLLQRKGPTLSRAACQLPPQAEDFVGRSAVLCEILRAVLTRAMSIDGPALTRMMSIDEIPS